VFGARPGRSLFGEGRGGWIIVITNGIQVLDMRSEVSASLIGDMYRLILRPSFGSNELDTLETVLDGLAAGGGYETWGLCAVDGETPVGCVLGYPFVGSHVLLIGYVTVRPGLRNRGIGGLLMDQVQQRWYQQDDVALVVAEVEDPRHHPATHEIDPKRRAAFYARRGAQVVVGPYFQPRLDGEGMERVHNLFLTVLGGNSEAITAENSVRAALVADFLIDYFRQSGEGSDWPRSDDEEGNRLLAWYRGRALVRLHPIGDYAQIVIPPISG
jgi:GNAT superfamily N-acetyltransferase